MGAARALESAPKNVLNVAILQDAAAVAALLAAVESVAVHQLKSKIWKRIALAAAVLQHHLWLELDC